MISVTKLNGIAFMINADWIRTIESTPDTVITLMNDYKILVRETPEQVRQKYLEYKSLSPRQNLSLKAKKAFEKELS